MTRATLRLVIAAVVVGVALASGIVLVSGRGDDTRQPERSLTGERGPEQEDHRVGELPAIDRATRRFLAGYLPLIYGQRGASVDTLQSVTPQLAARLKADPGRVPPGQAALRPQLQRLTVTLESPNRGLAVAQIKDSPSPAYPLTFQLAKTPEGWLVARLGAS